MLINQNNFHICCECQNKVDNEKLLNLHKKDLNTTSIVKGSDNNYNLGDFDKLYHNHIFLLNY